MDEKKTDALAVQHAKITPMPRTFSLLPNSLGEAMELAKLIADSDFAPKDYKGKPGNVMLAIQMGADVGLKPMQALQSIAVINGRPSIWGDAALALSYEVLEWVVETIIGEGDERTAICTVKRTGWPDATKRTFSVADAKKAKLWGKTGRDGQPTPWVTYPDRMLAMRARGFALRDAAADRLMGLVLAEEAQDYPAIEAMVISSVPAPESPLLKLPEAVQEHIGKAFELINASPALRLTKVNEFLGGVATDPDRAGLTLEEGAEALLEWCRTEFAKQKGKVRNPKEDTNGKKAPDAKVASPAPDPPARETPTAAAGPREVHRDPPQPKAVAKPEPFVVPSDLEF